MNFNVYLTKVKTGVIPFSGSTSKGINNLRSLQKWQLHLEAIKGQNKKNPLRPRKCKRLPYNIDQRDLIVRKE